MLKCPNIILSLSIFTRDHRNTKLPGRALTLEGAGAGLLYYVTPQWDYLLRGSTWIDGATQIFFAYRCPKNI